MTLGLFFALAIAFVVAIMIFVFGLDQGFSRLVFFVLSLIHI